MGEKYPFDLPKSTKHLITFFVLTNMNQLISVQSLLDIPKEYRQTPITRLLEYHNLKKPLDELENPEMIIGTCVDNRIQINFPRKFAYMVRAGGANMKYSTFKISYAVFFLEVKYMALIGHTQCGMSNLIARKDQFIQGLVKTAGWSLQQAEEHFTKDSPDSEIGNEIEFILKESKRLRKLYPKIQVVPMMYLVEDSKLYFIKE